MPTDNQAARRAVAEIDRYLANWERDLARRYNIGRWLFFWLIFAALVLALGYIICPRPAQAGSACGAFAAQVLPDAPHDGDTPKAQIKVRVWRADTPEADQPHGPQARDCLAVLIAGQPVTITPRGISFGRVVGQITTKEGLDVGLALVRAGYAWLDPRYLGNDTYSHQLQDALAEAQAARRGLWADPNPTPPWEWRKAQKAPTRGRVAVTIGGGR